MGAIQPAGEVVFGGPELAESDLRALRILHADMDAFYASVEVRRNPALAGRPLLVGGTGPRGVVTSASYEARAFGCRNAMPMARARRLCPQAAVLPPDFEAYRQVSREVMRLFTAVTPAVEPLALDEAFLDVRGATRLFGDGIDVARRLRADVRSELGLALTVGVASNKLLAKLASTLGKPDGLLVVPPSRALAFLHPLPVEALWGAGEATVASLHRYGLRTVGDIAGTTRATLERALGQALGGSLAELARGHDPRPVVPDQPTKSVGSEETFDVDIADADLLAREVLRSCARAGRRLRAAGLRGRTVTLKIRYADFKTITRSHSVAEAIDGDRALFTIARRLLDGLLPARLPIRLVGVSVSALVRSTTPAQLELGADRPGWEAAIRAADAVRARFGDAAVDLASLAAEEAPEAFREARTAPRIRLDRLAGGEDTTHEPSQPEPSRSGRGGAGGVSGDGWETPETP